MHLPGQEPDVITEYVAKLVNPLKYSERNGTATKHSPL